MNIDWNSCAHILLPFILMDIGISSVEKAGAFVRFDLARCRISELDFFRCRYPNLLDRSFGEERH